MQPIKLLIRMINKSSIKILWDRMNELKNLNNSLECSGKSYAINCSLALKVLFIELCCHTEDKLYIRI